MTSCFLFIISGRSSENRQDYAGLCVGGWVGGRELMRREGVRERGGKGGTDGPMEGGS